MIGKVYDSINVVRMVLVASALVLTATPQLAAQQAPPPLRIDSPTNGSIVNPGQTILVSGTSPAGIAFTQVIVVGHLPIGFHPATSVPFQVSISIPKAIASGTYSLTALGRTAGGQLLESDPIEIHVERPDLPTKLTADDSRVIFRDAGEQTRLRIRGTFSDGTVADLTESSNLTYTSSNSGIATVDRNGTVTAVAAGSASLTATYSQPAQSAGVSVSVPVNVLPPALISSPADLSFNEQELGTSSPAQTLTLTNVSTNQGLEVWSVSATGDFSETDNCATSSPITVGGMCTINVTFKPSASGSRTGAVRVGHTMATLPMTIRLTGTGICHYVSFSPSSSSVARGTTITVNGRLMSCATTTQTVVVQFVLTGPLQSGACGTASSVMYTTPPLTLQPNTQRTVSFSFRIPNNTCPGNYTITATTSVGGTVVDTSSATLTVTAQ